MDKTSIKKFAIYARKTLIDSIKKQALSYGISKENTLSPTFSSDDAVIINGKVYSKEIKDQLKDLTTRLSNIGYDNLIEEVAYTWFNRFIAIRFMEVNRYLPINTLVLSSSVRDKTEPDILTDALKIDLSLDKDKIYFYQDRKDSNGLYKYLVIALCNHLNKCLPFMFERINDYTELLFPDNILSSNSFIRKMVDDIPEENFTQVEIIGWLYQFYVSERNDEVQALLKKNIKVTKENIAPITQRFTPKWIVKYMVENTIGSMWTSTYKNSKLTNLKYLIKPADQEEEVNKTISSITPGSINPEDIKVLDPAAGSGHILVYAFEILYEIYKEAGYAPSSIPELILEKNLYGLEIDDRAAQLASFALVMKARSYKKDILKEGIIPNIISILESNDISSFDSNKYPNLFHLTQVFYNAMEYGSIIKIDSFNYVATLKEIDALKETQDLLSQNIYEKMLPLVKQAKIMTGKYDCLITNPPYMGSGNMNPRLSDYVKKYYKDSKSDMFAVFMELCIRMAKDNKYVGMITQHQWMFLTRYKKIREKLIKNITFRSVIHLGPNAFEEIGGEVVQQSMFTVIKKNLSNFKPVFVRLVDVNDPKEKEEKFLSGKFVYKNTKMQEFLKIEGFPIAYWINEKIRNLFLKSKKILDIGRATSGLQTSNNKRFLRYWYEVTLNKIGFNYENNKHAQLSQLKWFPYNKGGEYRKWYGNNELVVNWENDGYEIKEFLKKRYPYLKGNIGIIVRDQNYYFNEGITWSALTNSKFNCRYSSAGKIFDSKGAMIFIKDVTLIFYLISLLNSFTTNYLLEIISPTLDYNPGAVEKVPYIAINSSKLIDTITSLATSCIDISRLEWDNRETSWDFKTNELIHLKDSSNLVEKSVNNYIGYWTDKFNTLHKNEEEINKIFIDIYDMADELTPEVNKKDITILKEEANVSNGVIIFKKEVLIKQLISYSIGVMFGRYSLDVPGITYAGGEFDGSKYSSYIPDKDAIIPILSDDYFEDDIVSKFIEFLKIAFSKETLSQNIEYIANTLGKKANESSLDRIRRYFINEFYKDHVKMYKKRPIYFMFSSGREKAFNTLVYIHRYDNQTIAKLRLDYLQHLTSKLNSTESMLKNDTNTPKIKISKKLSEISKQRQELKKYDELLRHCADKNIEINLDDGIKVNYAKFENLVVKI